MERRLQERCADLQREVFRLQGAHHQDGYKNLDKRPVALPRHVPPPPLLGNNSVGTALVSNKLGLRPVGASELDDEGISSSETGQSMSPEPCLVLPMGNSQKYRITVTSEDTVASSSSNAGVGMGTRKCSADDDDVAVTIDEVIEELANIVSDAEREICIGGAVGSRNTEAGLLMVGGSDIDRVEKDIVPVNLLPQPPRKSRSLVHLLSQRGSEDFDGGSEYGMLMGGAGANGMDATTAGRQQYFDDLQYDHEMQKFARNSTIVMGSSGCGGTATMDGEPPMLGPDVVNRSSTNREILNVIMDAREKDGTGGIDGLQMLMQPDATAAASAMKDGEQPTIAAATASTAPVPAHKFSGVFFMAEMSSAQKYPKPDITAALEARRVTKNLDRMESYGSGGIDSMIDIVMTETAQKQALKQQQQKMGASVGGASILLTGAKQQRFSTSPGGLMMGNKSGGGVGGVGGRTAQAGGGSKLTDLPSGLY